MKAVAGFGIANIDLIFSGARKPPALGEEEYAKACSKELGGGPLATMIQVHRLGVPARLGTFIGTGELSAFLRNELDKSGIPYCNMAEKPCAEPLTLSCIISCKTDRAIISYKPPEEAFALAEDKLAAFYQGAELAYISAENVSLCQRLKEEGCIIVLDSAWSHDLHLEQYSSILSYVDYFIPNEKEALKITGAKDASAALEILGRYLATPIIKRGSKGCIYRKEGQLREVEPISVEHRDSTGAGDAFAAGLLYGLYHRYDIEKCLRFANITGGNAVSRVGCLSAYLDERGLMERYKQCYGEHKA